MTEIPLNKRDFSQLLLLAAGTMTDTNGTTNFTQQFAVNGHRGVEAVFPRRWARAIFRRALGGESGANPAVISRTAANLRQIQFSLRVMF